MNLGLLLEIYEINFGRGR